MVCSIERKRRWKMNSKIMNSFIIIFTMVLVSCAHNPVTTKDRVPLKQCQAMCKQQALQCKKICRNDCAHCQAYVASTAKLSYSKYVNEETVESGVIARDLNSYKDPLKCRKTTCNCAADLHVCLQQCGGVIHKSLKVPPVCG